MNTRFIVELGFCVWLRIAFFRIGHSRSNCYKFRMADDERRQQQLTTSRGKLS